MFRFFKNVEKRSIKRRDLVVRIMAKTVLIVALVIFLLAPMPTSAGDAAYQVVKGPIHDSDRIETYFLSSNFLDGESRVQILRPEKTTDRILFLLPVTPWPGFEEKWERLGSGMAEVVKHDFHNRFGYNIVVPDFPDHMPWFVDHVTDPNRRHESYMMKVVVPFTDQMLKIEKPMRDLAGFSKAGFGSLSLLLRHPDIFHAASVWDPGGLLKPYSLEPITGLGAATGSNPQFDRYHLETSVKENAAYFQGRKRIAISGYSNEAFLERLRALRDLLDGANLSYAYSESAQTAHRWPSGWLEQALISLQQMWEQKS